MSPDVPTTAHGDREETNDYVHVIRANIGQFSQQLLQVFFVGLTIGLGAVGGLVIGIFMGNIFLGLAVGLIVGVSVGIVSTAGRPT